MRDTTRKAHGAAALALKITNASRDQMAVAQFKPAMPLAKFYGRFMAYYASIPSGHVKLMQFWGKYPGTDALGDAAFRFDQPFGSKDFFFNWGIWDSRDNGEDRQKTSTTKAITGAWFCFEWMVDTDKGEGHVWVNDKELDDLAVVPGMSDKPRPWKMAPFHELNFGPRVYFTDSPEVAIWIDDLVLAKQRVGCVF